MNLVKWLRKNNKKLMAVVVVVIMVGFIGGTALQTLLERARFGRAKAIAHCLGGRKITAYDVWSAHQELEILRMLGADVLLRRITLPQTRGMDLRAFFLGEVLFGDRATAPASMDQLRREISQKRYRISLKQIDDIYRRAETSDMYWLLLRKEAEYAGVEISNQEAGRYLSAVIPRIMENASYRTVISAIVNRQRIPEQQILRTFGKLLAVLEYGRTVCSGERITGNQVRYAMSFDQETVNAQFVRLDSAVFTEEQSAPAEEQISGHFDQYKGSFAGSPSELNPCGFGYKLPARVRLEYIAVKLDDVEAIIEKPTAEEAEKYYASNRQLFTEQIHPDPNDPNSPLVDRLKSYAEVANTISMVLLQNKKNSKTVEILEEAEDLTKGSLEEAGQERSELDIEQLRQTAGDYNSVAEQLSGKYGIKVYSGRTGLLNAAEVQRDQYMSRLYLQSSGQQLVGFGQIVFAVEGLQGSELGPLAIEKPRLYENIGPFKDIMLRMMLVARVTEAKEASEPESVDVSFSTRSLELDEQQASAQADANDEDAESADENIHSVRAKVVEDLKRLAALETAGRKAGEFKVLIAELGWEDAVDKFNELYGPADANENDPNSESQDDTIKDAEKPFRLETFTSRHRVSSESLLTLAVQGRGNPAGRVIVDSAKKQGMLMEQLYSLVPPDSNNLETVPFITEFRPDMSYYCIKQLSINRVSPEQYRQFKPIQSYLADMADSQSLAVVHFNPENIVKRVGFVAVRRDKKPEPSDANKPADTDEES